MVPEVGCSQRRSVRSCRRDSRTHPSITGMLGLLRFTSALTLISVSQEVTHSHTNTHTHTWEQMYVVHFRVKSSFFLIETPDPLVYLHLLPC